MSTNFQEIVSEAGGGVRRSTVVWISLVVGLLFSTLTATLVVSIDRSGRAPIGAWISDFAKSPGLAGVCALAAASLALWGILQQVSVVRRSLQHQREVDGDRAWWERFEWTAARAVRTSKGDVPLPYEALLSTLTALATTAQNDMQRTAIGAITEVASQHKSGSDTNDDLPSDELRLADARRLRALQNYASIAGEGSARSAAVEAQLYERRVVEALVRITSAERVSTQTRFKDATNSRVVRPDAVVQHRGKNIIVEVKNLRSMAGSEYKVLNQVSALIESTGANAAVVVTPTALHLGSLHRDSHVVTALWNSPQEDPALLEALNRAAEH